MVIKKISKILLYVITSLVAIYICFWIIGLFQLDTNIENWTPDGGIWYCDDLGIQLSFSANEETYAIINGKKVICAWGNNKGTSYLSIHIQESGLDEYQLGESIFFGQCVDLTDTEFILKEYETGVQYSFVKVD